MINFILGISITINVILIILAIIYFKLKNFSFNSILDDEAVIDRISAKDFLGK